MIPLLILLLGAGGQNVSDCGLHLPTQVGDWRATEEEAAYDRATLFDYMNGGAEVYLSFDFKRVCARTFTGPADGEIVLDVYDMGSSAEAYGIFSIGIEDPEVGLGQGSEFGAGLLKFWKDTYFVSIVNMGGQEEYDSALRDIGRAVDTVIESTGPKPTILNLLPRQGLNERTASFFHSNVVLNNRFFIASENVLQLTNETNCAFGDYGEMGENSSLLIVEYPDAAAAEAALSKFQSAYMPEAGHDRLLQTESGNWTMAALSDNFMTIVFEAPSRERAADLLSQIEFN